MMVLALDTAAADCAVAVYDSDGDRIVAAISETIGRGHAERLMAMIDETLVLAGVTLADLGRIAVTVGPGSFTGIRVGIAAARGFALALGIPAIGISTLQVVAETHLSGGTGENVLAAIDAKRGEVFAQAFGPDGAAQSAAAAMTIDEAAALAIQFGATVAGSAAPLLSGAGEAAADVYPIAVIARLAARSTAPLEKPKPLYLRPPSAKPNAGFAVSRM